MGYDEPRYGRGADHDPTSQTGEVPTAVLEDVFDDPAHGDPGRDRLAVHLVWEFLLLIAVGGAVVALYGERPEIFYGAHLRTLLVDVVAFGLLALAAGLSLRTAAPNLAVGPVAVAAGLHLAEQGNRPLLSGLGPALVAAAVGGLALALVVVILQVPGWAASLAAAAGVIVFIGQRSGPVPVRSDYAIGDHALYLFAGFAAVALLGGLFGTIKAVRRSVGRFRPVADPARRRGGLAAVLTSLALVASTVFALLGGFLLALNAGGTVTPTPGLDWTVLAFGASLLGGTSAFGRRGGVAGTLLAAVLVTLAQAYAAARDWSLDRYALGAAALGVGLVVTRLVEWLGRPRSATDRYLEWGDGETTGEWSPRFARAGTWSPAMPEQAVERPADPWVVGRWEADTDRWDQPGR